MSLSKCNVDVKKELNYDESCLLGRGSSSFIFRGTFCGNPVAVKRIQLVEINSSGFEKEWEEKESVLRKLDHPNISRFLHVEDEPGFRLFVLEFCSASMDQLFLPEKDPKKYDGPIPDEQQVLIQIARGLEYIHSSGFIIFSFQPKNILISTLGPLQMKISSWCVRKLTTNHRSPNAQSSKGIQEWIAPEFMKLLLEDLHIKISGSVAGDIFSAGCVFFFFVSGGIHPFGNAFTTAGNIALGIPVNLSKLNKDHFANDLIRRMILLEPSQRIHLSSVVDYLSTPRMKFIRTLQEKGLPKNITVPPTVTGSSKKRKVDETAPGVRNPNSATQHIPVVVAKTPIIVFHPFEPILAYYTCLVDPEQDNGDCVVLWKGPDHSSRFSSWTHDLKLHFRELIQINHVSCLEWSTDGTKLAAGFDCGSFIIWDRKGRILFHSNEGRLYTTSGESFVIFAIHWNPHSPSRVLFQSLMATPFVDSELMIVLRRPLTRSEGVTNSSRKIVDMEWISPDTFAVCYSDWSAIEIWQAGLINPIKVINYGIKGEDPGVRSVCFNGALNLLASCQQEHIKVWLKGKDDPVYNLFPHDCCCIDWMVPAAGMENPRHLLACGLGSGAVLVWRVQQDQERLQMISIATLSELSQTIEDVAFSPDGKFFAAVDNHGSTVIWSTETWGPIYESKEVIEEEEGSVLKKGLPANFRIITRHRILWCSAGCKIIVSRVPSDPYSMKPNGISLIEYLPEVKNNSVKMDI